jgi:hypothetical protein
MTDLLPGLKAQLAVRAEEFAAGHGGTSRLGLRRGRSAGAADARRGVGPGAALGRAGRSRLPRGRRLGVLVLVTGVAVSSGAYAAKGLWTPQIGDRFGHGTIARGTVPRAQTDLLSVLRRPQTDADRGVAARYALRYQRTGNIRVDGVRVLTELRPGADVVLIPIAPRVKKSAGATTPAAPATGNAAPGDKLCLWVRDTEGGGMSCGSTAQLQSGHLALGMGRPIKLTPAQKRARAAAFRYAFKHPRGSQAGAKNGGVVIRLPAKFMRGVYRDRVDVVGVVPDGVASIRLGLAADAPVVQVRDNVWTKPDAEQYMSRPQLWFDAGGHEIPHPSR